jgi:hypothetical protein
MKPQERKFQTATQVKGLSPEIFRVDEADSVHLLEGNRMRNDKASEASLVRGLRPRYGIESRLYELGSPARFPCKWISADNPERKGSREDCAGVGLAHSRGVTGVMSREGEPTRRGQRMCEKIKGDRAGTGD